MCTMRGCGAEPLCVRTANAPRSKNYAKSACATHCESITRKANFSVGGTIKCAHLKKIVGCASTQFWRAKDWRQNVLRPGLIAKCARAKNHPTTRRCGPTLMERRPVACASSGRSSSLPSQQVSNLLATRKWKSMFQCADVGCSFIVNSPLNFRRPRFNSEWGIHWTLSVGR